MKLPRLKYNAAEIASLTVLLAVAAILAAVLLARSCDSRHPAGPAAGASADSIISVIDSVRAVNPDSVRSAIKKKNKTKSNKTTPRKPASRDYLDEPVNE